jgi:GNAT superfamily N-acetyltransferase
MKILVRPARDVDIDAIRELVRQLGYEPSAAALATSFRRLMAEPDHRMLVAADGDVLLGVITLHWAPLLQYETPAARIMTLVVDEAARGKGVGKILVDHAAAIAAEMGCGILELTSGLQRKEAHAFYHAIGFETASLRLARTLETGFSGTGPA